MDNKIENAKKIFYDSLEYFHTMICAAVEDREGKDLVINSIHKLKGLKDANYLELLKKLRDKHSIYMHAIRTPNESISEFQKSQKFHMLVALELSAKANNKSLMQQRAKEILLYVGSLIQASKSAKESTTSAGLIFYSACFLDLARIKTYLAMLSAISYSKKSK